MADLSVRLRRLLLGAVFLLAVASPGPVSARSCRPNLIPNGNVFRCSSCHVSATGGGRRTPFGEDVGALVTPGSCLAFWGPELAAKDSDGDGATNGEELQDPEGTWRPGLPQPGNAALVTNPGCGLPDTHCTGISVTPPAAGGPGLYRVTATAVDDARDPPRYTFTADNGVDDPLVLGPRTTGSASFTLSPGDWTVSVTVTDHCGGLADDATCVTAVTVCPLPGEDGSADTHCTGLEVDGPARGRPGLYTATATAVDDSGGAITYTFAADNGVDPPLVEGPQPEAIAVFELDDGSWVISVTVADACAGDADDASCERLVEVSSCPFEGEEGHADTHCTGLEVTGPEGDVAGRYELTATAIDDSGDPILYTFSADNGADFPRVIGPQLDPTASFVLLAGSWTLSVTADDRCPGEAADAACTEVREVFPRPTVPFVRADSNANGVVDVADGINTLNYLFRAEGLIPCRQAADSNNDGQLDVSDAIRTFIFLFVDPARPLAPPFPACGEVESELDCLDFPGCPG